MTTTSDTHRTDMPVSTRRSFIALGVASAAVSALSRPSAARAAISDFVMSAATDQDAADADPANAGQRTLPDSVWLWTTRTFRLEDGTASVTLRRSYDERGNILEHRTERIVDGQEEVFVTVYDYADGLPVYRSGLYLDGSRPETSAFEATFDDEGFPVRVTWGEDNVSTISFHPTGYVASDIEIDTWDGSFSPVCSLYDENGYPLGFSIAMDGTYRAATWDFDEQGYAKALSVNDTFAVYLDADAVQAVEQDLDSLDFADLVERFSLDGASSTDSDFVEGHAFELARFGNGGAVAYDVDGWWPVGEFTCETDDAGNVVSVIDEQGTSRFEATFEQFENPTAWAMCMSGYRFILGIL